jgi:hypothetical protein
VSDEAYAMSPELPQGIREGVFCGPARRSKQVRGSPRPQRDQPIPSIRRRPEHGIGNAERSKRIMDVPGVRLRNVASDQRNPFEPPERPRHALPQVSATLWHGLDPTRHSHARSAWRDCQNNVESAMGLQVSQQRHQRAGMETQRRAVADLLREAALHGAQTRCAREHYGGVPH